MKMGYYHCLCNTTVTCLDMLTTLEKSVVKGKKRGKKTGYYYIATENRMTAHADVRSQTFCRQDRALISRTPLWPFFAVFVSYS
jgi:hypothetical protein